MSETKSTRRANFAWREIVARYSVPSTRAAILQICTTLIPLLAGFVAMYFAFHVSYWLVLLLAIPTGGLLIRTFIIMHDCGHGSFLPSRRWNDIVGFVTGVLTLTPYVQWRRDHAVHHATSGNLEERGYGDVTTLTVQEYLNLSWWGRLRYRVYRNPIVMLVIGPWFLALKQRLPTFGNTNGKEIRNVIATNATLIGIFVLAGVLGALDKAALIYIPVFTLGGAAGVWLFYVQHQFEEAYWRPKGDWDYATAALYGSTYLKMPKVLQWFTGNIGLHHIHHLSPRIPNYRLQRCYDENPVFHDVPTLTLGSSFKTFGLRLWDEDAQRLVGFGHLRELKRQQRRAARAQAQAAA